MKKIYSLFFVTVTSISMHAMQEADLKQQLAKHIPTLKWNSFTYTKNELISLQNTVKKLMQTDDALDLHLSSVDKAITKYLTSVTYHPARPLSPATSNNILKKEIYHPLVQLVCEIEAKTNSPMSNLAKHITQLKWNSHNYLKDEIHNLSQTITLFMEQTTEKETCEKLKNIHQAIRKFNENLRYTNFTGGISPYRLHEIYEKEIYKPLVAFMCQNILKEQN
ncbi:MAG: hypothetical protein ACOYT8_06390 [Candidatus Dependentiae bacterium]